MPKPSASQIFCTVYLGPTTLFAVPFTPTILVSMVFKSWYLMIVCVQSNTNCDSTLTVISVRSVSKTEERSDLGVFSISDQLHFRKCQYWGLCYFFSPAPSFRGHVVLEPLQCKYGKSTTESCARARFASSPGPGMARAVSLRRPSPFNGDRSLGRTSRIVPRRRASLHCQFSPTSISSGPAHILQKVQPAGSR